MTAIYEKKVPAGQEFVFADGTKIRSIEELGEKISIINDAEFHRYVNEEKNDFVNWLVYSLNNEELANIIGEVRSRPLMYLRIRQYILKNRDSAAPSAQITRPRPAHHDVEEAREPREVPQERTGLVARIKDKVTQPQPQAEPQEEQEEEIPETIVQETQTRPQQPEPVRQPQPQPVQTLQQQPAAVQQPAAPQHEHEDIATEFVVKEFIYGVVCGILIGLIVAKIIQILF